MPLKDYTTSINARRTVGEIGDMLARAGALQIMSTYDAGRVTGLAFAIDTAHGTRRFSLPVNAAAVEKVLRFDRKVPPRYKTPEQAERVAWRIMRDWLAAQLAIIETEMVTLDEVMLSYMHADDGRTVFELYTEGQLRALGTGDVD